MADIKAIGNGVGASGTQALSTAMDNKSVTQASSFQRALEKAKGDNNDEALVKVCRDFESLFINMMFKSMRSASQLDDSDDGLVEKSFGRGIFEDMRDEELSKKVAAGGGIGIAKVMYKQLKKYAEASESQQTSTLDMKK